MAKTRSWSVKGIDGETRDLAREAAQASGMTIGAWIDQAILKAKHGELPTVAPVNVSAKVATDPEMAQRETAQSETVQPDLPLLREPAEHAPEQPTGDPQDQLFPETSSAVLDDTPAEPAAGSLPEPETAAPTTVEAKRNQFELSASNVVPDRDFVAGESSTGKSSAEPRPLVPPPALAPVRPSVVRYAVLGLVFAALLGVGGWLFVDLLSPDRTPTPQKIADAAPAVEAPPAPPATSSTAPPGTPKPQATPSTSGTSPGTDGLPAGLPDAIRSVISKARAGDPKAQYNFGMLYLSGQLGDKNPAEAAKWFERAAEQGVANAQFNLGVLFQRGEGVAQNDKLAFFWYQSAAEQNFPQAQHNLATAYAEGKGIARSYPKAAEWFAKSAGAGLSQSQYSLGALHERGLITGQPNAVEARRWYERALAQGDTRASVRLAMLDAPALPTEASSAGQAVATTAGTALGRADIRQIQTLLSRMSFSPGPADGQMGTRTADAIRLYQKFAGMDEDGTPSRELLEDLRAVAETMAKNG
ncbi:MAG: TPR repeat protein [Paracoccaceae bacterium]|jgi:TPR repeat protein